jgi:hypothetical protein
MAQNILEQGYEPMGRVRTAHLKALIDLGEQVDDERKRNVRIIC